jgi:hypothetical protein
VLDEQDRDALAVGKRAQQRGELPGLVGVQAGGRLVEQQVPGPRRQPRPTSTSRAVPTGSESAGVCA